MAESTSNKKRSDRSIRSPGIREGQVKASVYVITAIAAGAFTVSAMAGEATAPSQVMVNDAFAVEKSLTGTPGDVAAGRDWFANRKLGNCLACHQNADQASEPFHGEVGPTLNGAGDRWEPAQLRAIIANPKKIFGDQTIMPAFYSDRTGARTDKKFAGKTILSAQQVEDIVAYVSTLRE